MEKLCAIRKIYLVIIELQHLIDPRQMALLKEPSEECKEGTSAILPQSGLDEQWWADFYGMLYLSAKRHRSLVWWEDTIRDVLGNLFKGLIIPFGSLVEYHPISAKDQSRIHQFGKKVLPGSFL